LAVLRHVLPSLRRLLKPQGAMLLQAITIDPRAFHVEKYRRSFANTRIFPAAACPRSK